MIDVDDGSRGLMAWRLAILRSCLLLAFMALLIVIYFSSPQTVLTRCATVYRLIESNAWLIVALYIGRLAILLPAGVLALLTGMLYGTFWGEVIAVAGLTLTGTVEFIVMRAVIPARYRLGAAGEGAGFGRLMKKSPFQAVLMMRICFLPFDMVNAAAAWGKVPIRPFFAASVLGLIPGSLPLVMFGASITLDTWLSSGSVWPASSISWPQLLISVVLSAGLFLGARILRKRGESAS